MKSYVPMFMTREIFGWLGKSEKWGRLENLGICGKRGKYMVALLFWVCVSLVCGSLTAGAQEVSGQMAVEQGVVERVKGLMEGYRFFGCEYGLLLCCV